MFHTFAQGTCHSKVIKGKLPCQAVVNFMYVDEIPIVELSSLETIEQIRIAQRMCLRRLWSCIKDNGTKLRVQYAMSL